MAFAATRRRKIAILSLAIAQPWSRPWQAHDVRSKGADGAHRGSKCFDGTEDAQQLN